MTIQAKVAVARQLYQQLTGKSLEAEPGKWTIVTSLYGKESVMDTADSLEDALRLGETNRCFLVVELRGVRTIRYEPDAPRAAKLSIRMS